MKNKVLRLAIVAILVFAMVLSMAACGKKEDPTPSPTTSTTTPEVVKPTTPEVVEPTTPSTVKPSKVEDSVLAKEAFGIELAGFDKAYEGYDNGADAQYVVLTSDAAKVAKANYAIANDMEDWHDDTVSLANIVDGDDLTGVDLVLVKLDDGKWVKDNTNGTNMAVEFAHNVKPGTYEIAVTALVDDNGFAYAQYSQAANKEETAEYELEAVVNVTKADVVIAAKSFVAPVAAAAAKASVVPTDDTAAYTVLCGTKDASAALDLETGLTIGVSASSAYDVSTVGSYDLVVGVYDEIGTTDVELVEEIESDLYNITLVNGTQHFVSSYDWNVIRDTATSIDEYTDEDDTDMIALARARYDALTDAQKVFFVTGTTAGNTTTSGSAIKYVGGIEAADIGNDAAGNGAAYLTKLTTDEKDAADAAANTAATKALNDAWAATKFESYKTPTTFKPGNSTHMAAYNAAKAVYDGLTDAQKAANGTKENELKAVAAVISAAKVNAAKELISGAVAAYDRALASDTTDAKTLYADSTTTDKVEKYINNAEVKSLTAQAKTAFDALTTVEQGLLGDSGADWANITGSSESYKVALDALVEMNTVVAYMEQVLNYVNLDEFATAEDGSAIATDLHDLILEDDFMETNIGSAYTNGAMKDIISAYNTSIDRYMDKVIAEYKGWIDSLIALEDAKAAAVADLDAMIAKEFTAENDYTAEQIAKATSKANPVYKEVVAQLYMLGTNVEGADLAANVAATKDGEESVAELAATYAKLFDVKGAFEVIEASYDFVAVATKDDTAATVVGTSTETAGEIYKSVRGAYDAVAADKADGTFDGTTEPGKISVKMATTDVTGTYYFIIGDVVYVVNHVKSLNI